MKLVLLLSLFVLALALPRWLLTVHYASRILNPEQAPKMPTALVLGAGLRRDGLPTRVLADRVETAVQLYHQGKVDQLLMSGSVSHDHRDEPAAMRDLALALGVPESAILVDDGGDRTYQSCLRAQQLFAVSSALIVSQRFHLPRALALCTTFGITAYGVTADLHAYRAETFWNLREIPATLRALWDAYVTKPGLDSGSSPPGPVDPA